MLSLLNSINEPLSSINLLLDKENGLFLALVFFAALVIVAQHIPVFFTNAQVRGILRIQRQFQFPSIIENEEIRYYIALCFVDISMVAAGLRCQFDDLVDHSL